MYRAHLRDLRNFTLAALAVVSIPVVLDEVRAFGTIRPPEFAVLAGIPNPAPPPLPTVLTDTSSESNGTSYATASISPSTDSLLIAYISTRASSGTDTAVQATVTGNGLSWAAVDTAFISGSAWHHSLQIFCAQGTPSPGAVTFDFGSQSQTRAIYAVLQIGSDPTAGSCSDNIIQTVKNQKDSDGTRAMTVTLAAFDDSDNRSLGIFSSASHGFYTAGLDYTILSQDSMTGVFKSAASEYNDNAADVSVDITICGTPCADTNSPDWAGIALEVAGYTAPTGGLQLDSIKTDYVTVELDTTTDASGGLDRLWIGSDSTPPASYDTYPAIMGDQPCRGWGCRALQMARDSVAADAWVLRVWEVTSLASDASNGTLQGAIDSAMQYPTSYNVILITVGGTSLSHSGAGEVELDSLINTRIVGQTAKGRGFTSARWIDATGDSAPRDLVLQYLDVRVDAGRCLRIFDGDNIVIDHFGGSHCGSGSGGGIIDLKGNTDDTMRNVSVEYSLLAWATPRTFMSGANSARDSGHDQLDGLTLYSNCMIGPGRRMPHVAGSNVTAALLCLYNWNNEQVAELRAETGHVDWLGVYAKRGPASDAGDGSAIKMHSFSCWDSVSPPDTASCPRSVHVADLRAFETGYVSESDMVDIFRGDLDGGDSLVYCRGNGEENGDPACAPDGTLLPGEWTRDDTLPQTDILAGSWAWQMMTDAVLDTVQARAGQSRGLNCDGSWSATIDGFTRRIPFDSARLAEMDGGSGQSAAIDPAAVGYEPDTAYRASGGENLCVDTNGDFLPDSAVKALTGDPLDSLSIAADDPLGRNQVLAIDLYLDGFLSQVLSVWWGDSIYRADSIQVRRNDGTVVDYITPTIETGQKFAQVAYENWAIGDSIQIVTFGCDVSGWEFQWNKVTNAIKYLIYWDSAGDGGTFVLKDSAAAGINDTTAQLPSIEEPGGWLYIGDSLRVAAVSASDTSALSDPGWEVECK